MNESCPKCGGSLIGDGYTSVVHCEYVEDTEGYEPDAGPVFCEELMKDDELRDVDIDNLKHMLGADSRYKKSQWGFRNRFAAGGADVDSMRRLESAGLVREVKSAVFCGEAFFVATEAGCKKLGFNKKQIANAMDF